MNRERAETYLRLLAEAEIRDPSAPLWPMPWSSGSAAGNTCRKLQLVAQALTVLDALEAGTAEAVLADFDLAVSARHLRRGRSRGQPAGGVSGPAIRAVTRQALQRAQAVSGAVPPPAPWPGPPPGARRGQLRPAAAAAPPARPGPGAPGPGAPGPGVPEPGRFLPVGLAVPFRDEEVSGSLYLMAFAHTAAGARFTLAWRTHGPVGLTPVSLGLVTITDDRGGRYQLHFTGTSSGPDWTGVITLRPDPPGDLRWLDICPPGGTAVRVCLGAPADVAAQVSRAELGPGEHLLTLIAERLLFELRLLRNSLWEEPPGLLGGLAAGLGEVVAGLEAAELLPPASPVPARLAALCASLGIEEPGLTAPAMPGLPEQWLSLLAHYHRRKPDAAPHRDGIAAALAAALPELDGIRLALIGLHNAENTTFLHLLAEGLPEENRHGPFGIDMYFALSLWLRDAGGRWHLARPSGRHRGDGEDILRLRLTPPLTRPTPWVDVLLAGRSAQVRARVPLRWERRFD
jgi:hypothetical protein